MTDIMATDERADERDGRAEMLWDRMDGTSKKS